MSDVASDHAYPQPGDLVDAKYEIRRELGSGGMGAVLEATHLLRKARVALKFMSPRIVQIPGLVERFLNEGVVASRINNEHVVAVLDVSRLPSGLPYLVMEHLEGQDLRQLLAREGHPGLGDVPRAVHFVLQVLRGLQAAHQVGIVHRDLKPANCFVVERDGEPDFIKLVDFGISKLQEGDKLELTQAGAALGTPLYISPEQAHNPRNVDARTDLYSVAVILYELLTGRTPFAAETGSLVQLFQRLATTDPPSLDELLPDAPPGLAAVVARGLARAADDRFQSCAEFAVALLPFADARSELCVKQLLQRPSAGPLRLTPAPPRPGSTPPRLTATATAIALPARDAGAQPSEARPQASGAHEAGPSRGAPRSAGARWGVASALLLAAVAAWAVARSSGAPQDRAAPERALEPARQQALTAAPGGGEPPAPGSSALGTPGAEATPAAGAASAAPPSAGRPAIRPLGPSGNETSAPAASPAEASTPEPSTPPENTATTAGAAPPSRPRRVPALEQIRIED